VIAVDEERPADPGNRPGPVETVVVADRGRGIPDVELAMTPGWSTATPEMRARGFGAGLGLPNIKNSADEFRLESTPGVGTTLTYAVRLA